MSRSQCLGAGSFLFPSFLKKKDEEHLHFRKRSSFLVTLMGFKPMTFRTGI